LMSEGHPGPSTLDLHSMAAWLVFFSNALTPLFHACLWLELDDSSEQMYGFVCWKSFRF
jgi:hypothetical protein